MGSSSASSSRRASAADRAAAAREPATTGRAARGSRWEALEPLPREFYARNTLKVARDLLGKVLFTRTREGVCAGRIVETEAYRADDPASHSCRGLTPRTAVMHGPPGRAYVYFIYGNYEMLNFVTEPEGAAGAVLIRALEPLAGEELMGRRRAGRARKEWTSGPGRLCLAMGVEMRHNGEPLDGPVFRVVDDGFRRGRVLRSPRVGISRGTDSLWRFFLEGNEFVSRAKENKLARGAA